MKAFHVKGMIPDLVAFLKLVPRRRKTLRHLPQEDIAPAFINRLAEEIHPDEQHLIVDSIREETPLTKTFRLKADPARGNKPPAVFRAGQYIAVREVINGHRISRPYSIASAPADALDGFYDLTLKRLEGGFLTGHIWNSWTSGTAVTTSGPFGFMSYEPLRDSRNVVGIAGGSGVTPFRSMAREIAAGRLDARLTLIYGCTDPGDMIFREEFMKLEGTMPDRFRALPVYSGKEIPPETPGTWETGFITAEILRKYSNPEEDSYFLCGPAAMYDFVENELISLSVPRKRIRMEAYGEIRNPGRFQDFPREAAGKRFAVTVHRAGKSAVISASSEESLLVTLEREGLAPPSVCRSGECQMCRTRLTAGSVWISPKSDGRRAADRQNGYVHPCVTFPISDIEVELPATSDGALHAEAVAVQA